MSLQSFTRAGDVLLGSSARARPLRVFTPEEAKASLDGRTKTERDWAAAAGFTGEAGQQLILPGAKAETLATIKDKTDPWAYAALMGRLPQGGYSLAGRWEKDDASQAAFGWAAGSYAYDGYKAKDKRKKAAEKARLVWPKGVEKRDILAQAEALFVVRDLINTPAEDMGPPELASAARALAKAGGAKAQVTVGQALIKKNFPAIHRVGRAAEKEPRLIELLWKGPKSEKGPKVALVGKGVCFDSGGLDIKGASNMALMKKDMGGAAHVLGLAHWIMQTKLPIQLQVLIPAVENAISGNAYRPGDIVPTRKGLTIEVGNTDAEGRVVLSDALTYAAEKKPDLIIDFATLTGAARVAVGTELPALFTNDDALAADLEATSRDQGDLVWRLPLHQPYRDLIKGRVGDINNSGSSPFGGAITAALFLESFVPEKTPWAHFDIMGWNSRARPGRPIGGEAMGMRCVYHVIRAKAGMK